MVDIKTAKERSRNMAAIRSKDTKPEIYLRRLLYSRGYRYRKNTSTIPGSPDLYLLKYHVAIFVNGCFWHRHGDCKYAYTPKSKVTVWSEKFKKNIERDKKVRIALRAMDIRCITIWECTIKKMKRSELYMNDTLQKINLFLNQNVNYNYMEI